MQLNPPVLVVKITKEDATLWLVYCHRCVSECFTGPNNFFRHNPLREELLRFNVNAVAEKLLDKLYKHSHCPDSKLLKVKLLHSERLTFSIMFTRAEVPPALTMLEREILNQLETPTQWRNNSQYSE